MKALTLTQPWASGVILEIKQFETRSWRTNYRGHVAIHASKRFPKWAWTFALAESAAGVFPPITIPCGQVLGVVNVLDCVSTERLVNPSLLSGEVLSDVEQRWGDYSPKRWAWQLEVVRAFRDPIPAIGALGLWDWDETFIDILGHEEDRGWRPQQAPEGG